MAKTLNSRIPEGPVAEKLTNYDEEEKQDGRVNHTDHLPTAEPSLTQYS